MFWGSRLAAGAAAACCVVAVAAAAGPAAGHSATVRAGLRWAPASTLAVRLTASPSGQGTEPASELAAARLPVAVAVAGIKKGVSVWAFRGVAKALAESGASWYYTWAAGHAGITSPRRVRFVPMIWGAGSVTAATLREVRREGPYLLGFNEPDSSSQSDLTVSQALALWPRLMATGLQLGSPAVATDAATPGGWLDRFMHGARTRHYRVSFITVHWYGADFGTGAAVGQLESYLRAIHARYHLPIWLTEFALIRFGATTTFPAPRQQAAFVTAAAGMLHRLRFVQRYAWFALPATAGDGTAGLFRSGPVATAAGRAFEAVHG